jgi:predicted chitinase
MSPTPVTDKENKKSSLADSFSLAAKNFLLLPGIARDLNEAVQSIIGIVKQKGGEAKEGPDEKFIAEQDYKTAEKLKAPTAVTEEKAPKKKGILGTLMDNILNPKKMIQNMMKGFRKLLSPKNIMKVLGKIALPVLIVSTIWVAISSAFEKWKETGSIWEAYKEAVGSVVEFLTLGLIDKETIKNLYQGAADFLMPVIKPIQEFFGKFSDWVGDKFNSVLKLFGIDIKPKEAPKETPQKEQVVVPDILKSKVTDKEKDAQQKAADLLSKPVTLPAEAPPPKPEVQPAAPTPTLLAPKPAPAAPAKVPSKEEKPLEVSGVQATIVKSLNESGVTSPKAHANVLATVKAESNFKVQSENLNYSSPQRIQDVFGKRRIPSVEFAQPLVNNPEGLANEVYKTTDGNSAPGDGFKYRGRGFIQHTGKNQYAAISKFVGVDVLSNPDSLNSPEVAAKAIPWFLLSYKGLKPEDVENMSKVNKAIAFADPTGKKAAAREASSQQIYAAMSSGPTGSQVATASNEVSSGQRQQAKSQTPMIINTPTTNNTKVVNNQPATMTKDKANPTNMVLARVA